MAPYDSPTNYFEYYTRKKIKETYMNQDNHSTRVICTDNTYCDIVDNDPSWPDLKFKPLRKSICLSCGEDHHCGKMNDKSHDENTDKVFWEKVRKLYWYRYLKNKPNNTLQNNI